MWQCYNKHMFKAIIRKLLAMVTLPEMAEIQGVEVVAVEAGAAEHAHATRLTSQREDASADAAPEEYG